MWFSFKLVSTYNTSPIMADSNSQQKLLCPYCPQATELFLPSHYIVGLISDDTSLAAAGQSRFLSPSSLPAYRPCSPPSRLHRKPQSRARLGFILFSWCLTGMLFCQEVQISMPYASPQTLHQREVVVRTFSEQSWSDLRTRVEQKRKSKVSNLEQPVTHVSVPLFGFPSHE